MNLIGLARIGQDVTLRYTPDNKPVANLSLAFNYGRKGQDGKRPTQWIDAALFGDRAVALEQYLVKGQQLYVHLADPHIETFRRQDGTEGTKIVAFVNLIEFAGPPPDQQGQQQAPQQRQPQQQPRQSAPSPREQNLARQHAASGGRPAPNFSDMDDDIPF